MNRQMAVKQQANSRQMEFGIGMDAHSRRYNSIPQTTELVHRQCLVSIPQMNI
jgi:hypothetical protein